VDRNVEYKSIDNATKKKQSFFKKEVKIRKYTNLNRAPNADSSWSSAVKLRNALKILFYYKFNIK